MTSIVADFVTATKTENDLLHPATYRSIVEMIKGVLKNHDLAGIKNDYTKLLAHVINFDDPHLDNKINFLNDIVSGTYAIYVNMLANPLSLADFTAQIVPSLQFLELFRRITLNRALYNQVKQPDGSVPSQVSAYLSDDWGQVGVQTGPVNLVLAHSVISEIEFIKLGWNGNTAPFPTIFDATNLSRPAISLPTIFETSAMAPVLLYDKTGPTNVVNLELGSNDITLDVQVVGTPLTAQSVLTIQNDSDIFQLMIGTDRSVSVLQNSLVVLQTAKPILNGRIGVTISKAGYVFLDTNQGGFYISQNSMIFFNQARPFSKMSIDANYEDLVTPSFGIRSLSVHLGCAKTIAPLTFNVPAGYALLTDPDGAVLFDPDGVPLMDYDVTVPANYILLIDDDGSFLMDDDGSFIADTQ